MPLHINDPLPFPQPNINFHHHRSLLHLIQTSNILLPHSLSLSLFFIKRTRSKSKCSHLQPPNNLRAQHMPQPILPPLPSLYSRPSPCSFPPIHAIPPIPYHPYHPFTSFNKNMSPHHSQPTRTHTTNKKNNPFILFCSNCHIPPPFF
jgi:hypothetical protein